MLARIFFILILVPIAVVLIALSVANRNVVTMNFDPVNVDNPIFSVTQPFFVFLFSSFVVGLLIGSFITWWKQGKYRKLHRQEYRELQTKEREMESLKEKAGLKKPAEIAPGLPMVPDARSTG